MDIVVTICRVITLLMCCISLIELFSTMGGSNSAIQQAAGAAMAAAGVIIPYVFTRMLEPYVQTSAHPQNSEKSETL